MPGCAWPSSLPVSQPGLLTTRTALSLGAVVCPVVTTEYHIDQAACKQQKFIPVDLKSKSQGLTIPVFDETLLSYRWRSSCYSLHEQKVTGFLQGLYYKGPNPDCEALIHLYNLLSYHPMPPPNIVTLGIRFQSVNFCGAHDIQSVALD